MSKKEFVGRKFFNTVFIITMFFGGGLIPTFILVNQLHMVNTVWAILLPGAFNVWNMILARTYYQSIPKELREASAIDGANEIQHFFRIMLPVCKPIIAVLALWSFVGMWNSYFDAMIYLCLLYTSCVCIILFQSPSSLEKAMESNLAFRFWRSSELIR